MRDTQKHTYWFHELARPGQARAIAAELARRRGMSSPYIDPIRSDIARVLGILGYEDGGYDDTIREVFGRLNYNPAAPGIIKEEFPAWLCLIDAVDAIHDRGVDGRPMTRLVDAFERDLDIEREAWLDEGEIAYYLYTEGFIFLEDGEAALDG